MKNTSSLPLTLKVVTPEGSMSEVFCDSIILSVKDNEKGKGGGSYGIRKGHAKTVLATSEGEVSAYVGEERIFHACLGEGLGCVDNDTVTVISTK